MSMPKRYTEWIRLVAPPEDKQLLDEITKQRQNDGFSETVRQLIREEAARRNLTAQPQGQQVAA
jgi:hypothetical protein